MAKLTSKVPSLISKNGWTEREFIAKCIMAGLSQDTAKKLMGGHSKFSTDTWEKVMNVFQVGSINQLIDKDG